MEVETQQLESHWSRRSHTIVPRLDSNCCVFTSFDRPIHQPESRSKPADLMKDFLALGLAIPASIGSFG